MVRDLRLSFLPVLLIGALFLWGPGCFRSAYRPPEAAPPGGGRGGADPPAGAGAGRGWTGSSGGGDPRRGRGGVLADSVGGCAGRTCRGSCPRQRDGGVEEGPRPSAAAGGKDAGDPGGRETGARFHRAVPGFAGRAPVGERKGGAGIPGGVPRAHDGVCPVL